MVPMSLRHLDAGCAGVILGCVSGEIVVVLFPQGGLRLGIELILTNGAVVGVVALVVSLVKARRPPP